MDTTTEPRRGEAEARMLAYVKARGHVRTATQCVRGAHINRQRGLRAFWSLTHAGVLRRVGPPRRGGSFVVAHEA